MEPQENQLWDPASRSLAEALNLSLKILKGIMVLLILLFLSSGIFTVKETEQAMVIVFGKIRNIESPILKPGLHWTWPYPFGDVIKLPATQQNFEIGSFWYHEEDKKKKNQIPPTLDPLVDGYCLTSDNNIIHFKWQVRYRIEDAYLYLTTTQESDKFLSAHPRDIDQLVYNIACASIIVATVNFSAQDAIKTSKDELRQKVQTEIEKNLIRLKLGLKIEGVELLQIVPPRQVQDAFESVTQAERECEREIESAKKEKIQIVNQANSKAGILRDKAKTYAFDTEKKAKGNASNFRQLAAMYEQNPQIFLEKQYLQMAEDIGKKVQEVFLLRDIPRELRLQLNRNPNLYRIKPPKEE